MLEHTTEKVDPRKELVAGFEPDASYDFRIYTDGSGYAGDGYGGHGALVVSERFNDCFSVCGAASSTTVFRQELCGVLAALREIFVRYGAEEVFSIHATIDNDALTYSIARNKVDGNSINRRNMEKEGDLWAAYAFFERKYMIVPEHMRRKTNKRHDLADMMASELRVFIREYFLTSSSCFEGGTESYKLLQLYDEAPTYKKSKTDNG